MGNTKQKAKSPLVKSEAGASLPRRFVPRFWSQCDGRMSIVQEIRARVERLEEECGADSYARQMLVQRAVFLALQLETAEVRAAETGEFEPGVYAQMTNALSGLLSKLGLDRAVRDVENLADYVRLTTDDNDEGSAA